MIDRKHNFAAITCADWLSDLGPEGGGQIIATGTPEDVASLEASHTGRYLNSDYSRSGSFAVSLDGFLA